MKRMIVATLVVVIAVSTGLAQNGSLKGVVTDATTGDHVSFTTVAVMKAGDESALVGSVSDENGVFLIEDVPFGTYNVVFSFLGFQSLEISNVTISAANKGVDLGTIEMEPRIIEMEEAEVSSTVRTSVDKIDRRTYRAGDFETARGGTAMDVLSKLPSISVSSDEEISVRGSSDFVVYLNGKPVNTNASVLLGQIPGENIQNIDIITVPTSRYDAQGKGGIINITTKRVVNEGLTLMATGMLGGSPWKNDTDVFSNHELNSNRMNGGLNLFYNMNRLSLHGAINYTNRNNKGIGDIYTYIYQDETQTNADEYYILDGIGARPKWDENLYTNVGFDYKLSERSQISTNYVYSDRNTGRAAHYKYNTFFTDGTMGTPNAGSLYELYNPNDIHRKGHFQSLNVDYYYDLNDKTSLQASLLYENSNLDQTIDNKEFAYDTDRLYDDYYSDENSDPVFHSFQSDETPLDAYRASIDFNKEFENGNALNLGVVSQLVRLEGIYKYDYVSFNNVNFEGQDYFNNSIDLSRDVYAAYAEYVGTHKKLSYIAGVRLEYLDQQMDVARTEYFEEVYDVFGDIGRDFNEKEFKQNRFDIFPTLHLRYQATESDRISLSATHRVNRPPAKDMAPFLYRRHQEIFEMGDPLLEPEYSWNADLSYNRLLGKQSINLTGFVRSATNAIYRVNRLDYGLANTGGVLLRSYTNAGSQLATGGELGLNLSMLKRLRIFIGGSIYQFAVESNESLFGDQSNSSSLNWDAKTNLTWTIIDPLRLTFDYAYKSQTVTPQGEDLEFQMMNVALNFAPEKIPNWTFFIKMLDVLQTNQAGGFTGATADGAKVFQRDWVYDYEGQIVELGVSFNFNQKKEQVKQQLIGNEYF